MDVQRARELKARLTYVKIVVVDGSQLPYRVERKRNGSTDGVFRTKEEAEAFILRMDLDKLAQKPTRGRQANSSTTRSSPRPRYRESFTSSRLC